MGATTVAKAICDSYGKYFIAIKTGGNKQYLVWGEDATDNHDDKILLDKTGKVLLFDSMYNALQYILKPSVKLFDSINMKFWAQACSERGTYLSCTYDLDILTALVSTNQFADLQNSERADCLHLLSFVNVVSDYAYQTNDQHLLHLRRSEPLEMFLDHTYNHYLWTVPEEGLAKQPSAMIWQPNYTQFKAAIMDLINSFISRCAVP